MLNNDTLYLVKDNRATKIINLDKEYLVEKTIKTIIDEALWPHLCTFEGRVESTRKRYGFVKYTPIYINQNLILQPIYSQDAWNTTYVNICNVKNFYVEGKKLFIEFINSDIIITNLSFARFKHYMSNCDIIKKNQNK